MNEHGEENPRCYFHPTERIIGVCAFCLNERLLILASKQRQRHNNFSLTKDTSSSIHHHRKPSLTFPKIFALGSFLHRHLEFQKNKSDELDDDNDDDDGDTSTSLEDSFISIKFEDNGVASWDKGTKPKKVSLEPFNMSSIHHSLMIKEEINKEETKSVVEHVKPQSALRWRKRIGQLFQIVRRKRSSKANVCHVGSKAGGVKVRNGWIRSLTKRRTNME